MRDVNAQSVLGDEWLDWKVTDEHGRMVGRVVGTIGHRWLIVGHRPSHHVLVPTARVIAGGGTVFVPYPQDLVLSAPRQRPHELVAARHLEAADLHYGLRPA